MRGWSRTLFTRRVSLLVTSRIGIQTQRRFAFLTCVLRLEWLALIPTKCSIGLEQTSRRPGRRKLTSVVRVPERSIPERRDRPTDRHHVPQTKNLAVYILQPDSLLTFPMRARESASSRGRGSCPAIFRKCMARSSSAFFQLLWCFPKVGPRGRIGSASTPSRIRIEVFLPA